MALPGFFNSKNTFQKLSEKFGNFIILTVITKEKIIYLRRLRCRDPPNFDFCSPQKFKKFGGNEREK